MTEDRLREIDCYMLESLALRLVNGHSKCRFNRELMTPKLDRASPIIGGCEWNTGNNHSLSYKFANCNIGHDTPRSKLLNGKSSSIA